MTDDLHARATLPHLAGYIEQLGQPATLEDAIRERDSWIESAAMFSRNEDYYRGLVDEIGALFGDAAYIADDGSRSQDILRAKVPELARLAFASPTPEPSGAVVEALLAIRGEIGPAKAYAESCGLQGGTLPSAVHIKLDMIDGYARTALASLDAGSASS